MTEKRVLIIKGSPRQNGNSAILADQVAAGAREAGAKVESFYLHDMDIAPCDACDACRAAGATGCIIDDDMQILYQKIEAADAMLIATPIYWFSVSAQVKIFMDRWYGTCSDGVWNWRGIKVGVVATYGDSDPYNSGAVNAFRTLHDAFSFLKLKETGLVYGSADEPGEIRQNELVMKKAYDLGTRLAA